MVRVSVTVRLPMVLARWSPAGTPRARRRRPVGCPRRWCQAGRSPESILGELAGARFATVLQEAVMPIELVPLATANARPRRADHAPGHATRDASDCRVSG